MHNGSHAAPPRDPAAPGPRRGARLGGFAYALVIAGVLGGLLWIWQSAQNVRGGTLTVAGSLLAAAVARLLLPERSVPLLSSRRRLLDVAAFGLLALALAVAGLIVPVPS